jgi:hypothetical protein
MPVTKPEEVPKQFEVLKQFADEIRQVDDVAQIVLKGHLVMEGLLTEIIETFMLHGEFVEIANLRVHQKIALCRAMSTSDQNNGMWELVSGMNTVRNALAHSLDPDRRSKAIQKVRNVYEREFKDMPNATKGIPNDIEKDVRPDLAVCLYATSAGLGYLHAQLEEVRRFKSVVVELDKAMNKGALSKLTIAGQ